MEFALGAEARNRGYRLASYSEIGSTNAEALAAARGGDPGRIWFVTGHQTAGRGRRGRAWVAPPGNLAASLLVVSDRDPSVAASLGFVAGLSLDEALRRVAPSLDMRIALDGIEPGNLLNYLHFEQSGGNTLVHVSSTGGFADGYSAGKEDNTIVLDGVDVFSGGLSSDQQIIQDLLSKGKLLTD